MDRQRSPRRAAGDLHGRHVPRQPAAAEIPEPAAPSAARLRARAASPSSASSSSSRCRSSVASTRASPGPDKSAWSSARLSRHLPAATDVADGRDAAAIARWVETTPRGVSWLGYFYGGNLAGAVVGSLLAGFYLLRVFDMPTATGVAVALNVVVALLALVVAARTPHTVITATTTDAPLAATARSRCRGSSTSPSRCRVSRRSDPKSCGRACSRCSLARRRARSR